MKLSIIVPVYNMASEGKLNYCLDSLMAQRVDEYEIIAVDDASTDESLSILRQYHEKYPEKIKVYSLPENRKQGGAKNEALLYAAGEYIGFVDSDDWVSEECFSRLLQRAEETGADVVACDFCYVYEHTMLPTERVACNKTEQVGELTHDRMASLFLDPGALVTKIYKRELFYEEPFRFPEGMFYEDNATGIELLRRAGHFEYIPEPMYFYYQHSASTVHTTTRTRCENRLEAMRIMHGYAIQGGYLQKYYDEIEYKFITLFYQNTLFSYMQSSGRKSLSFIHSMGREMSRRFPDFEQNKYYVQNTNAEEKRLIRLQQRSTIAFMVYYTLLNQYRKVRRKISQ